jgi:acyl carrier protein
VDTNDITARLKTLIVTASNHRISADDLQPRTALTKNGLALDSVAVLQLLVSIEDEFGILLDDNTITVATFESLDTLAAFVGAQVAASRR